MTIIGRALHRAHAGRLAGATVILVVTGGVAMATGAIPNSQTGEVHLCYQPADAAKRGGSDVSIVDDQATANSGGCKTSQRELVIAQKGPRGDTGATGAAGGDGEDGVDGEDGAQGPTGATGPAGKDGAQGPAGAPGPTGAAGRDGAQGPAGPGGASTVFYVRGPGTSVGFNEKKVVEKPVPAGNYVVSVDVSATNRDTRSNFFSCSLFTGSEDGTVLSFSDASRILLGPSNTAAALSGLELKAVLANFDGGRIYVTCQAGNLSGEPGADVYEPTITAIKVGAIA